MADEIEKRLEILVAHAADKAYLVDFDGTMVDLVPHPNKVEVEPALIADLRAIAAARPCAFAIVSGRPLAQLDAFLPNIGWPLLACHGAELRLSPDTPVEVIAAPLPPAAREAVRDVSDRHACFFEDKLYSLSLHLPFTHIDERLDEELASALGPLAQSCQIRKVGRTYEILQNAINKGAAIRAIMARPGFAGRKPVYIGDDVHSDDSLAVVTEMGGELVGVRHAHDSLINAASRDFTLTSRHVRKLLSLLAKRDERLAFCG